jgi:tRNA nucleotidyltransferase (CCA-adding enzyme)
LKSNKVQDSKTMSIYRVGGYVRDKLLGITPHDCDYVVTGSSADEMLHLGYTQVGKSFPVFLHPKSKEEYALARTEKKIASGHTGFSTDCGKEVTLEQDLSRRDITINAIAEDINGKIIDPFNGVQDLQNHIIRHVSPAFSEDPLRILRVARFAARFNFSVANETMELLTSMGINQDGLALSRERILNELDKALGYKYTPRFFTILIETKNLAVFFPSLAKAIENQDWQKILISTLEQLQNSRSKYLALAYTLMIGNLQHRVNEFATDKKMLNLMKHAILIFEFLAYILQNKSSNEQLLDLLKKSNALRDAKQFSLLLQSISELPYFQSETSRSNLKFLAELSLSLTQLNFSDLANNVSLNQNIEHLVQARQLLTINLVRTNYGI